MRVLTQSLVLVILMATLIFLARCGKIEQTQLRAIPEITIDCDGSSCL